MKAPLVRRLAEGRGAIAQVRASGKEPPAAWLVDLTELEGIERAVTRALDTWSDEVASPRCARRLGPKDIEAERRMLDEIEAAATAGDLQALKGAIARHLELLSTLTG